MDFRVFSSKIVHAELTRAGYRSPHLRTVARWTSSGKAPGWAEQAMRELVGVTKAAPDWERLMRTVDAIAERVGVSLEERTAVVDAAAAGTPQPPPAGTADHRAAGDLAAEGRPDGHGQ